MPRNLKIVIGILAVAVIIGLISLGSLRNHMKGLDVTQSTEEQARRAVLEPPISTPTDQPVEAKIFWAAGAGKVAPVEIELPLSADPVERSEQLLQALIANPSTADQRTLPASTTLLGFYILPDGTAVADFSDSLASELPSGILSESMAVDSIVRTLAANMPQLRRLKILIHGQEVDTLAGHVDLTGFFDLNPAPAQQTSTASAVGEPAANSEMNVTAPSGASPPALASASQTKPSH
ncbi:MAG TPA: GerMN domain-containing protein [Candidatus Dormibacteraeota bacterium]|nr:GerMN domain-containing protein [Candidatus Dormibacteraeota bacterium]